MTQNGNTECYTRIVNDYYGSGRPATQVIKVREHGSSHVKIDLFVNGEFAGTWIKTSQHFANIVRWGSWAPTRGEAITALAHASASIPHGLRDALADALEKAVPEWVRSVKKKE